jgi:hypothetical protein
MHEEAEQERLKAAELERLNASFLQSVSQAQIER